MGYLEPLNGGKDQRILIATGFGNIDVRILAGLGLLSILIVSTICCISVQITKTRKRVVVSHFNQHSNITNSDISHQYAIKKEIPPNINAKMDPFWVQDALQLLPDSPVTPVPESPKKQNRN